MVSAHGKLVIIDIIAHLWVASTCVASIVLLAPAGHCCKLNHGHYVTTMNSSCTHRLFNSAAERVMCNLRHRLFSHLMNQEIGFFDRIRTGELMNRLSEVSAHLQPALWHSVPLTIPLPFHPPG